MDNRIYSLARRVNFFVLLPAFFVASLAITGCGGSEEATGEEAAMTPEMAMQKTVDSLKAENASLRSQVAKLEQDNRSLTAKSAELETKLAETQKAPAENPAPAPAMNPEMEYQHGLSLHHDRNYQEAISVFMGLLNTGAPEGLESNCHYWIGECYYGMKNYKEALTHFEQVGNYPRTTKKDDAQLMIANCYHRMGDHERAKKEYQKLIDEYPASQYVERAKSEMAKMK